MLLAGVVAGPLYVIVSLLEVVLRDDFDPRRQAWSNLANGDWGWIHSTNLIVSGLLIVLGTYRWNRWVAGHGLGMVVAGVFEADPVGSTSLSTAGLVHFAAGGVGFVCLIIGCWKAGSRAVGVLFALAYVCLVAGGGAAWSLFLFTAAVIMVSVWISVKSLHLMRNRTMEVVR